MAQLKSVRSFEEFEFARKTGDSDLKVFILEDDLELLPVFKKVLESIDPTVLIDTASSVEDAIKILELRNRDANESPYDLIIADIFLEGSSTGLDFWHTCEKLYQDTPVIITSAMPVDQFFATLGNHTISPPFLAKPFSIGQCKQMFEGMLKYKMKGKKNRDLLSQNSE
jgi:response regulator of citrate/malate metabolism